MASVLLLDLGDPEVATGGWDVSSQHSAEAIPAFRKGICLYLHRPSEKPGVSSLLLKKAAREGNLVSLWWLSNEALCRRPFMCLAPELTDSDKPVGPASRDCVSTCRRGQQEGGTNHRSYVFFSGSHTRWGGGGGPVEVRGPWKHSMEPPEP